MAAQGRGLVLGAQHAALLEQRDHVVDEVVEARGREVRRQHEPVGATGPHEVAHRLGHVPGRSDEGLAAGRLDDELPDAQLLGVRQVAPEAGRLQRVREHAGPTLDDRVGRHVGVDLGERALGVVGRQVAVPQLLEQQDGRLRAHLLAPDHVGLLGGVGRVVAQHVRHRRQDLQLVGAAAVAGQAALGVGVEALCVGQARVTAEDGVGGAGGQLAAAVGVARLEDDGVHLGAAGHVEVPVDVELRAVVGERARRSLTHEAARVGVGHQIVVGPRLPELAHGLHHLAGPLVAVLVGQEAAPPEVLAGEGVRRRDHVPRRPSTREVVEAGQLAGQLVGLAERGVQRAGQPQVRGHRSQRGQHGHRVGPAHRVEVVDPAPLLAQAEPFGEEEEVELAPLGRAGQVDERVEVDLALRARIGPHRGVVHAGEVGGQDHLHRSLAHRWFLTGWPPRRRRSGSAVASGPVAGGAARARRPGGTRRRPAAPAPRRRRWRPGRGR